MVRSRCDWKSRLGISQIVSRRQEPAGLQGLWRCARLEPLEERQLLAAAPVLSSTSEITVLAGTPYFIALDDLGLAGDEFTYSADSTSAVLETYISDNNRSVRMVVDGFGADGGDGIMEFELFEGLAPATTARIIDLINSGFYNTTDPEEPMTFHRVVKDFMIQGGDPTGTGSGGSDVEFNDEFTRYLMHTVPGLWSMAKSFDDTNDSQWFITDDDTRFLDFNHTIFGFLTSGDDVRQRITAVDVALQDPDDSSSEESRPVEDVVIESMTVFEDHQNGVLQLYAPLNATGSTSVTVTVTNEDGQTATHTFDVNFEEDTENSNPFLGDIPPIFTDVGQSADFSVDAWDREGDDIYFGVWPRYDWWGPFPDSELDVEIDPETGQGTVTPTSDSPGVYGMLIGANPWDTTGWWEVYNYDYTTDDPRNFNGQSYGGYGSFWDFQFAAVFVNPEAPTGIELREGSDTGQNNGDRLTNLNNRDDDNRLQFRVTGVVPGATVILYADGEQIGQATASGSSVDILTDGDLELTDGSHAFTARQILEDMVDPYNPDSGSYDLDSDLSDALVVNVDTAAPQITSTPILEGGVGQAYTYNVQTDVETAGQPVVYNLRLSPAGMLINVNTGEITWTPKASQSPSRSVIVRATDAAGNWHEQEFEVDINEAPELVLHDVPTQVAEGTLVTFTATATDPDGGIVFSLGANSPAGATIDAETGVFTWTPAEDQGPANQPITVQATDSTGATASKIVVVKVTEVNVPPVFKPVTPERTVDEGELIEFTAEVTDPDIPQGLKFYLGEGAPEGASIDLNTGRFTWRPGEEHGRTEPYTITLIVEDAGLATDEVTFNVVVNEVDDAPVFEQVDPQLVGVGDRLELLIEAVDPDIPTNAVTYALEPGAPAGVVVDAESGLLTWTVPDDYPPGDVEIAVRATELTGDGQPGLSSVLKLTVVVSDPQEALMAAALTTFVAGNSAASLPTASAAADAVFGSTSDSLPLPALSSDSSSPGASSLVFNVTPVTGSSEGIGADGMFGVEIGPPVGSGGGIPNATEEQPRPKENDGESNEEEKATDEAPKANRKQTDSDGKKPTATVPPEASDVALEELSEEELAALAEEELVALDAEQLAEAARIE